MTFLVRIRLCRPRDLGPLSGLEQAAFAKDAFSVSLIDSLMTRDHATVFVAEHRDRICGAAYILWKKKTLSGRLFNLVVHPEIRNKGVGSRLVAECERETACRGYRAVTLEVRKDNTKARKLYDKLGYCDIRCIPGFYEDGSPAVRMEKRLEPVPVSIRQKVPYCRQTTPFSCGPACLMMAIRFFRPEITCDRTLEMNLWKTATLVFMASGIGGADPYGLALAAAGHGLSARVLSCNEKNPFALSVRNPHKREVVRLLHEDMKVSARRQDIAAAVFPFDLADMIGHLYRGWLPIVLISTRRLTGFRGPHWVLVTGADADYIYIHDPDANSYAEDDRHLAVNRPVSHSQFIRLMGYGRNRNRFVVFTGPEPEQNRIKHPIRGENYEQDL